MTSAREHWLASLLNASSDSFVSWFEFLASRLLFGVSFFAGDTLHRLTEIEFYYHAPDHPDPFTHCHPRQLSLGQWYFHRTANSYRGGSFKGVDLTFGGSTAFGGVLIRGLQTQDGQLIDGPSLCVDQLLACCSQRTVSALDDAIAGRYVWDMSSPVRLVWHDQPANGTLYRSARVGLSLKQHTAAFDGLRFLLRPYRFLSEPRRIRKGRTQLLLALLAQGLPLSFIRERTGCNLAVLRRYLADYHQGANEVGFDAYVGSELGPRQLARLLGQWHRTFADNDSENRLANQGDDPLR